MIFGKKTELVRSDAAALAGGTQPSKLGQLLQPNKWRCFIEQRPPDPASSRPARLTQDMGG